MEFYGLILKPRKIIMALLLIILGVAMVFYGFVSLHIDRAAAANRMTDAQIIERAKELGMVELKDSLLNQEEN